MKKVAIIDDDIHIGDMLTEVLSQEGYAVLRAYSGTEALYLLSQNKPDLVLLDLMLPGLSGEEVLPHIENIPVIVLSAKVDVQDKVNLLLSGAADYMGESGSGKTTLLNILASLDKATAGSVVLDGMELSKIKESKIAEFRRDNLGFVFQEFNLLDTFSVEDNIYLPLVLAGKSHVEMETKLLPIAKQLGITELLKKYPYEISGGQKQRVAVARALITNPKLILADEPTGALDSKATDELLRLFGDINFDGQTILMVTHSVKAASHASRVLFIKDGEVFHQIYRGNQTNEQLYQVISNTLTMLATGGDQR